MIPILSICSFTETLRRFKLHNDGKCVTCSQQVIHNELDIYCVICLHSTHLNWPKQPWMYLWASDMVRNLFFMAKATGHDSCIKPVLITDLNMLSCESCFMKFLEEIEDSTIDTSYEPIMQQIRTRYDIKLRSPNDVPSPFGQDETSYPSILLGIEGRTNPDDTLSRTSEETG